MITHCPYCEYAYPDKPLSLDIMKVLTDPNLPSEDYMLWIERLIKPQGLREYNGVKIHIGRKHKGELNWVTHKLNDAEEVVIHA